MNEKHSGACSKDEEQIFVGQERALGELFDCLDRAISDRSPIVLVTGEVGAGKTRLVDEFLARACDQRQHLLIGRGACYPYTEKVGYFAIQRAFESMLLGQKADQLLGRVVNKVARFTWNFAPELIGMFLPPASPLLKKLKELMENSFDFEVGKTERFASPWKEGPADPQSIWHQFAQLLVALAEDAPVLIFLDDLHWADQETLELLAYLGRHLAGRVLLIGTYRPYEVNSGRGGEDHPLQEVRRDLLRAHRLREIAVSPLPVREYISQRYKMNAFPLELFSFLQMRTEGTALFLTELLEEMEKDGTLRYIDGCWQLCNALEGGLPESIEAVLEGRLNSTRLGNEAHAAVVAASIEGHLFTAQAVALVRKTAELEANRLLEEDLEQRHRVIRFDSLEEVPGGTLDHFSFRHNLFQDYLYRKIGRVQRRLLHASIGEVLERLYAGAEDRVALDLARHFREARDWDRLAKYALAAAKLQARTYSFKEVRSWCEEGLRAARRLLPTEQDRLVCAGLLLELGQAEGKLSGIEVAIAQYRQAEEILSEVDDKGLLARTHFLLGKAMYETKQWEEATQYLLKALESRDYLQAGEGCAEILKTLRFIFKRARDRGYKDFLELCDALVALNDRKHESLANVDVLEAKGNVFDDMGLVDQAITAWTAALEIAKESNDEIRETRMLRRAGRGLRDLRRFEESLVSYTQSRHMAKELGRPDMEIMALGGMAQTHRQMGQPEQALRCRQEQLEIAREIGDIAAEATALRNLGFGLSMLGRKEQAQERYREDLQICRAYGLISGVEKARNNLAAILKHRGVFAEALVVFEELLETGRQANDLNRLSITLNHIGQIYLAQGRAQEALECHQQVLEILSSRKLQEYLLETQEATSEDDVGKYIRRQALTLRFLSDAYLELGNLDEAFRCCSRSIEIYGGRGRIDGEGGSWCQMGFVFLATGDTNSALESFSKALAMLETAQPESVGMAKNGLALAFILVGDRRKALTHAQEAVSAFESIDSYRLGDARLTLARAYQCAGDTENALKWADLARAKFVEMGLEHRAEAANALRQELSSA